MVAPQHLLRSTSPIAAALVLGLFSSMFCILWFMLSAMESERIANQQRLEEMVHQSALNRLKILEGTWLDTLNNQTTAPKIRFRWLIDHPLVASVIIWNEQGGTAYPETNLQQLQTIISSPLWKAAQRLEFREKDYQGAQEHYLELMATDTKPSHQMALFQALSRTASKSGEYQKAIQYQEALIRLAKQYPANSSMEAIVANAHFRIIELVKNHKPIGTKKIKAHGAALQKAILDYQNNNLSSRQRLALALRLGRVSTLPETFQKIIKAEAIAEHFATPPPKESSIVDFNSERLIALFDKKSNSAIYIPVKALEARLNQSINTQIANNTFQASLHDKSSVLPIQSSQFQAPLSGIFQGLFINISQNNSRATSNSQVALYILTGAAFITLLLTLYLFIGWQIRKHERSQKLRTDILATVSHELKTPLTSTRILIDNLKEEQVDLPSHVHEYIDIISNENYRLSSLVDNFMIFSRMERNKHAFSFEDVSITQIIKESAHVVSSKYPDEEIQLLLSSDDHDLIVQGDESLLKTALINLIDNAFKYSPNEKSVSVDCQIKAETIELSVVDQGIGLSE